MAKKKPEGEEPKPGKADAAEVARRVEEVLRIRLDGAQYHDVVQYAAEKHWDLKERQLREYMARADDLLVRRQEKSRKRLIARRVAQREALYARCVNAADHRTALAVLSDLDKLQGLYPEKELKDLVKLAAAQAERLRQLEARLDASGGQAPGGAPAAGPATGPAGGAGPGRTGGPAGGVPG